MTRVIEADEAALIVRAVSALESDDRTLPLLTRALYQVDRESSCVAPSYRDRACVTVRLFIGDLEWSVVVRAETTGKEIVNEAISGRESAIEDQRMRVARQRAERSAGEMAHLTAAASACGGE